MTQKHTPGPWRFDPPHDGVNEYGTYEGAFYAGDVEICTFGDSKTYYNTCGEPPNTANASLIAAAPELLDALMWMVAEDDTNEGDVPLPDKGGRTWNEINAYWIDGLNKARAAIAKAKGETQ